MATNTNASATSIQTTATIQNVSSSQPLAYIDQMIAIQSMNAIQNMFDKKNGWSKRNLITLLAVISIDGIKKIFTSAMDGIAKAVIAKRGGILFKPVGMIFKSLNRVRKAVFKKRPRVETSHAHDNSAPLHHATIEMDQSLVFWQSIIESPALKYDVCDTFKMTQKDVNTTLIKETWKSIQLQTDVFDACCTNNIEVEFELSTFGRNLVAIEGLVFEQTQFNVHDLDTLTNMIPYPEFCRAFSNALLTHKLQSYNEMNWVFSGLIANDFTNLTNHMMPVQAAHAAMKDAGMSFKSKRAEQLCFHELYWLLVLTECDTTHVTTSSTIFGIPLYRVNMFCGQSTFGSAPYKTVNALPRAAEVREWLRNQICPVSTKKKTLVRWVLQSNCHRDSQLVSTWNTYIDALKEKFIREKIKRSFHKTYVLKVKHTYETKLLDNPEYAEYESTKQMVLAANKNDSSLPNATTLAMLVSKAPPKHLKEVTVLHEVEQEEVTEIFKDFSTLYLRKNDKECLLNCLHQFKNKKDVLRSLGIPHKLGIMLYGLPGCGKTSTISAIATYLEKDLFYVHLNNIKTNEELKMIFDHVNKKCVNGGIIVMEDIDAMTTVVHKRDVLNRELCVSEINCSSDGPLTLEYFLNILQGSLTVEGTIFITTTNHLEVLDPAFYRDGRFDIKIEMLPCDHHQMNDIYFKFFNKNIRDDLLDRIPENKHVAAEFIFHFVRYIHAQTSDEVMLEPFLCKLDA
jgi:hypothetical protein